MKKITSLLGLLAVGFTNAQESEYYGRVGINTETPNATLEVAGQPINDMVLDGIIAPKITGDQLREKIYTSKQEGAMVYVNQIPSKFDKQVWQITSKGYYYFNGKFWEKFSVLPSTYNFTINYRDEPQNFSHLEQKEWTPYKKEGLIPTNPHKNLTFSKVIFENVEENLNFMKNWGYSSLLNEKQDNRTNSVVNMSLNNKGTIYISFSIAKQKDSHYTYGYMPWITILSIPKKYLRELGYSGYLHYHDTKNIQLLARDKDDNPFFITGNVSDGAIRVHLPDFQKIKNNSIISGGYFLFMDNNIVLPTLE